ncbi:hypothetical protein QAD02_020500 [Eretmocerus hayati]|uniref:Uncharacterized protein n=1 Tax=Eretmocerus hayati TaxID=131215 RepID=A0ACC2PMR1_9HYME|nr:hypothetical protein QAD02_020500 [Eretmocerus hayati]
MSHQVPRIAQCSSLNPKDNVLPIIRRVEQPSSSQTHHPMKTLVKPLKKLLQLPITQFFKPRKRREDESSAEDAGESLGLQQPRTPGDVSTLRNQDSVGKGCTLTNLQLQRESSVKKPLQPLKFFRLLAGKKKNPNTNQPPETSRCRDIIDQECHATALAPSTSADPAQQISSTTTNQRQVDVVPSSPNNADPAPTRVPYVAGKKYGSTLNIYDGYAYKSDGPPKAPKYTQ